MSLTTDFSARTNPHIAAMPRHDWTRARGAGAVRAAIPGSDLPGADHPSREFRSDRSADLDPAVDQDRRLSGRLRLLPAEHQIRHRRQSRKADGARRGAGRSARGQGGRREPLLHGRGLARAEGPRSRQGLRHGRRRARARARDLRHPRHADRRAGAAAEDRPASITTTTTSTPRRNITAPSSPPAPIRSGSTRSTMCAMPASMSAAAALSAWARAKTTASA